MSKPTPFSDLDFMLLELSEHALWLEIDYDGGTPFLWVKAAFKNKIPGFEEQGEPKNVIAKWAIFALSHLHEVPA